MKLYVVINHWKTDYTPKLFEVEVVEKPKTYILVNNEDRWKVGFVSRISKSVIGRVYEKDRCIALSAQEAIKGYREYCQKEIAKQEEKLDALKKHLVALDNL